MAEFEITNHEGKKQKIEIDDCFLEGIFESAFGPIIYEFLDKVRDFNLRYRADKEGNVIIESVYHKPESIITTFCNLLDSPYSIGEIDSFISSSAARIFFYGFSDIESYLAEEEKIFPIITTEFSQFKSEYSELTTEFCALLKRISAFCINPSKLDSLEEVFRKIKKDLREERTTATFYEEVNVRDSASGEEKTYLTKKAFKGNESEINDLAIAIVEKYAIEEIKRPCSAKRQEIIIASRREQIEITKIKDMQLLEEREAQLRKQAAIREAEMLRESEERLRKLERDRIRTATLNLSEETITISLPQHHPSEMADPSILAPAASNDSRAPSPSVSDPEISDARKKQRFE
jgi:hypothetical protein